MRVKNKLSQVQVRPSKERGQNFLIDHSVIDSIVSFGDPKLGDAVVEIGPGLGALTEKLQAITPLTIIEIEPQFCKDLQTRFSSLQVINQDVRTVDFSTIGKDLVVFGNLPYSFSTDIIFHLIDQRRSIARAIVMLQKEFADRMGAGPGGKDYGVLSISCQLFCDIRLGRVVPGNSFHPPTKVQSRVLEMKFLPEPRFPIPDLDWFKRVVKGAFLQRRKKIHNSLKASCIRSGEQIMEALQRAGIDSNRRAETLSIEEFVKLSETLR